MPEMMRTERHTNIVSELSRHIDIVPAEAQKLALSLDSKNYNTKIDPITYPERAARNLRLATLQDEMKAVLSQSHTFTLVLKLDFYWVDVNLVIDRKSRQR